MQNNVNSGTNIALPVTSSQMPQMVNVSAAHQQAMSMGHLPNNIELNMNVPGGMAPMTVNHTSYIPTQPQNQMQAPSASIQSSQSQVHQQHAQQQQQSHISNQNYTNGNGGAQQQPMHMSGGSVSHVPYTMPMSQQDIHSQQIVPQPQQQQQQSANVSVAAANYPMSAPASVTSINATNLCDMSASSGVQNNPSNNHNAINSQNASNASNMNVNNATNYVNQNTNLNSGCVVVGGGGGNVAANSDRTNPCATSASIVTGNIVMTGQASQTIVDSSAAKVMSPSCAAGTAPSVAANLNNTNNPNANGSATAANASASCSSTAPATVNNANATVVTSTTSAVKYTTTPENETGMNAVDGASSKATTSAEDGQSVEDSERYVCFRPITVFTEIRNRSDFMSTSIKT